jgi:hypothetical protein
MNLQQQVQNVAAQGRYGDSMLMHVNPAEVRGLAQVAPLTINPKTGQPEAFLPFLAPLIGSFLGPKVLGGLATKYLGKTALTAALKGGLGSAIGSGLAQYAATGDAKKGLLAGITGFGINKALEGFKALAAQTAAEAGAAATGASAGQAAATKAAEAAAAEAGKSALTEAGKKVAERIAAEASTAITPDSILPLSAISSPAVQSLPTLADTLTASQGISEGILNKATIGPQIVAETLKKQGEEVLTPFQNLKAGFKDQKLGDSIGNLVEAVSAPAALIPITIGAGQSSVLDSQELFAAQMAQREEERRQQELANIFANEEPILFNAGGMTSPNQSGIDEGVLMDANILAQSLMPATEQMMAEGGIIDIDDIVQIRPSPSTYAREMDEMYGSTTNVQDSSTDMQRFAPALRAYDVNPDFRPGFQPETMYFAPGSINQPTFTSRNTPDFVDSYTGSKGGFGLPEFLTPPRVSINPYEAFTSEIFQGLLSPTDNTTDQMMNESKSISESEKINEPSPMSENMANNLSPDIDTPKESVMDDISKLMDEMYTFADGGQTSKELPNKGLEALNKVAPDVVEKMGFQEGGSTDMMQDPIVQATIEFILGENDNQQVINDFIAKYGNEVFLQLRDTVLQSLVPGAQTEGLIEGNGQSGMADDIPGMIGANEKVAVSQDEFIVPADVVSALGDGSSDAGSNELYKMMDRVREEKTGDTTQPPRIDVNKVMPA